MPALYLTEDDVNWLIDMESSIEVVQQAFQALAEQRAENQPRRRVASPGVMLHVMSAAAEYLGYVGFKAYTTTRTGARFHVAIYDTATGEMAALIEANRLGQLRTGATTAVATDIMANMDASLVGCFGTGFQARAQLLAICKVRKIERIEVYSRNDEHRRLFADEMTELCNVPVVPMNLPDEVAAEKDIIVCATTSKVPVFDGRVLDEGTHVNAIGSNFLGKREIDETTIRRANHIVVDSIEQCRLEAGDFVQPLEDGVIDWPLVRELSDVIVGRETGRANPDDITLFKSVGLAIEDVALAAKILKRAREQNVGQPLPF